MSHRYCYFTQHAYLKKQMYTTLYLLSLTITRKVCARRITTCLHFYHTLTFITVHAFIDPALAHTHRLIWLVGVSRRRGRSLPDECAREVGKFNKYKVNFLLGNYDVCGLNNFVYFICFMQRWQFDFCAPLNRRHWFALSVQFIMVYLYSNFRTWCTF